MAGVRQQLSDYSGYNLNTLTTQTKIWKVTTDKIFLVHPHPHQNYQKHQATNTASPNYPATIPTHYGLLTIYMKYSTRTTGE